MRIREKHGIVVGVGWWLVVGVWCLSSPAVLRVRSTPEDNSILTIGSPLPGQLAPQSSGKHSPAAVPDNQRPPFSQRRVRCLRWVRFSLKRRSVGPRSRTA